MNPRNNNFDGFLRRLLIGAATGQTPDEFADQELAIARHQNEPNRIICPDCGADVINDGGCFYCETSPAYNNANCTDRAT